MIVNIGNDIVEIERFEKIHINKFMERYFTEDEISLFKSRKNTFKVIAGNYAVKEALSKCLGTGIRGFRLKDIEVLRDDLGKPYVNIYGKCAKIAKDLGIDVWHVTISNTERLVSAVVIGEKLE